MNNDKIIFDLNIGAYMSLINKYLLNNNLGKEDIVLNCIEKLKIKIPEAINTKNYLEKGAFPIIDQGKKFIGGYSDEGKNLFDIGSPVIIFGDHTRNLKYIDFPFILGADGVKVIKPKSEFIEKYFYYSLYSINIESKGYNRHYKYLMNGTIVIPNFKNSLLFQNKVLAFLECLEKGKNILEVFFDKETENQILNLHNKIKEIHLNLIPIGNKNLSYIKQLKQAILQEAIEGKLTKSWREQNPGIEPASVLLEKIKKEREELVKQKKLKKQEKLKEISEDEIPFEIPENSVICRLGDIIQVNPRNQLEDNLDVSFIPMKLINDGFINTHTSEKMKWSDIKSGFTHFQENDVVFAKITPCFQNRKSAIMKNLINGFGAGTTELIVLRSFNNLILPELLLYFVKSKGFIDLGVSTYTGTAGQQRVDREKLLNMPFLLPPLEEQKEIVKKVDEMMKFCDELEKQSLETKENSEKLMKSVLSEVFNR